MDSIIQPPWRHAPVSDVEIIVSSVFIAIAPLLITPHDIDGALSAVTPGNRYGFRTAARHIGAIGRRDRRRISMCPIPGNIICIGGVGIARCGLRPIQNGFAVRWFVEEALSGPEATRMVSPDMPERSEGDGSMGNRMRRSRPAASGSSRPGECGVRDKHERNRAERRVERAIHSMRHDTYQFVGDGAALWRTLGPAFGARKRIINY
jgi:hypothetical protein